MTNFSVLYDACTLYPAPLRDLLMHLAITDMYRAKGKRQGQRSIRLNKGYRAIYEVDESGAIHFVEIVEVNKHAY